MASTGPREPAHPVSPVGRLLQVILAAFAIFHLYTSLAGTFPELVQRGLFIGVGVGLVFLAPLATARRFGPVEIALAVAGLLAVYGGIHVAMHSDRLMDIMNDMTSFDKAIGAVLIVLVLEASRRSIGLALPIMSVLGLAYYLWGASIFAGDWAPPRVSFETGLSTLYGSTNGMFGFMADIGTRVIAIYVVFGSLLVALGAGDVFMRTASLVAGRQYGGHAKVAVISSALFGTVSGSAVANVMSVGSITIPTMMRAGYRKDFAAGIEASASAGGQIMPPVMGAGAFIMAELLNIPYATIALAAALPAVLYFAAIYFSIDCYARGAGLRPLPRSELPRARDVLLSADALTAFGPMVALGYLLFTGYTPTLAGAVATLLLILFAGVVRLARCLRDKASLADQARAFGRAVWAGLVDGGQGLIVIATLLACSGLLVTVLTSTGLAVKFSQLLIGFSGEQLVSVLLLTALLCILLGMDVPTTASYILTASVAAPTLARLGLDPLAGHLFIFYFAILSAITPPVCASVYAAATIAQEGFWKVAGQALRIAGGVYLIPFLFVYRPELLLQGSALSIVYTLAITGAAIAAISGASIGHLLGRLSWPERLFLYATASVLMFPASWTDATGILMLIGFVVWRAIANRSGYGRQASKAGPAVRAEEATRPAVTAPSSAQP